MVDRDSSLQGGFDGRIRLEIGHRMRERGRHGQPGNIFVILHIVLRGMREHDVGSHLVKDGAKLAQVS